MANHFRTDEQQESSFDDRFGVISQDDLNQLDQQDVVADQVETQDFSADVPVAQAAEPVTTVSDPFASGAEAVHVVTAEQQNNPEQAPLDRAKFFADLAQDAPKVERTGTPTISFKNASLVYPSQPNRPALDNISADIYPGEFVFVVGHSGSGKSSLLRLITREQKATHGQVIVAGQDLTRMRNSKVPYLRRQIGTVFQDFKLLPDKTVYENVSFALECIGKPRPVIDIQVPEVLRLVGLGQKMSAYPDQLSGGEQQRVSVARAMVNRPPLLICDEPTGNLDPAISLGIMKLLDRINRAGTTVVMATHDREMVDSMRKRVIALEAGHIVRDQEKGGYGYYGAL
ncbi:MAG: cell division ATP-binding protein FtsE [Atopobium sp.]|uniref:cell division ATP-binding protein FtsE n=1 Tax=Atopobiaceae TaxID=1643824 RepID=UPI00044712E8|nr:MULTISPECIES: cell division ATP-binding protein FtsE [Atopobiaceae]MBF0899779.1 cell division ATP-binding protein FtsE [Atopobium sp.]EWC94533.1 cell division ATP-binding protein FtsE [Atopobium sp. ICM42b]MBF0903330.1 cell division ATP-binding protein FtsE [Atopobium sp.]MBF0925874.1 cell division ATP-binding protein FtsE [Atopobium sp.]MBF0958404.1 cell division ATP-binding protein FtsE [Atopobium sp.]